MIDADGIRKKAVPHNRGNYGYSADIRKWAVLVSDIDDAPTIDAVPVVRCGECKHFGFAHDCNFHAADENGTPIFVREDDFCSYGERKEAEGDG